MAGRHLRTLFQDAPDRFKRFSFALDDLLIDISKQRIDGETMRLLLDLARAADLEGWRDRMFAGEKINSTENRAVLHVALRNRANRPIMVDGADVMPEVNAVLAHMRDFSARVRSGEWRGNSGRDDHRHRQYRHWRLGSRSADGVRGAEALSARRPQAAFRLQCRRRASCGHARRARPGADVVHRRFEDVHHAGDDGECRLGEGMVA